MQAFEKIFVLAFLFEFAVYALLALLFWTVLRRLWSGVGPWIVANVLAFLGSLFLPAALPESMGWMGFAGLSRGFLLSLGLMCLLAGFAYHWVRRKLASWSPMAARLAAFSATATAACLLSFGSANLFTDKVTARYNFQVFHVGVALVQEGAKDPSTKLLMTTWARLFPDQANAAIDAMARKVIADRDERGVPAAFVQKEYSQHVAEFIVTQSANIQNAPDENLMQVLAARIATLQANQDLPSLCAALATGDRSRIRLDDPVMAETADSTTIGALNNLFSALIEAAAAGETRPLRRDSAMVDSAFLQLASSLDDEQVAFLDGGLPDEDASVCQLAVSTLRQIARLPPDQVGLIMTGLVQGSDGA